MAVNTQNFERMLDFTYIPEWDRENTIKWLDTIIDECLFNNRNTDPLDYERLIYTEAAFPDDEEIQSLVDKVKQKISCYYKRKKQLLNSCSPLNNPMD